MELLLLNNGVYYCLDRDEIISSMKDFILKKGSFSFISSEIFKNELTFVLKKTIFLPLKYEFREYIENYPKLKIVV